MKLDIRLIRSKKGQPSGLSGASAAVLVGVIAALIVIYILMIPPEDRAELLDENTTADSGGGTSLSGPNSTLLVESPGRLDYISQKEVEHTLPSVNLYTTTDAVVLQSRQSIYVKNAWFDKSKVNLTFSIPEIEHTEDILLSFNVKNRRGRLIMKLNGNEIVNNEFNSANAEPIKLPKRLLEDHNTLEIMVSGVGWKFWRTNEYILENIKITADVTDVSTRESELVFQVTGTEKNNLDRVFVKFFPDCDIKEVGPLEIVLNNNRIYSSVPDCGILRPLEVSPHLLLSGENKLKFSTTEGSYLIDNIVVKTDLKEMVYPTYYFEINKSIHDDIVEGDIDVILYFEFVGDTEQKKA
ncbi:MAG: hypothetical protein R6U32_05950 [Candidatus Woesearchaeota archaeon]